MQQVAKCEGIEPKRIFGLAGLTPAKTVSPEIAERIAHQFDERGRRLLTFEGRHHDGMIRTNEPIVGGQPLAAPVDPAGDHWLGPGSIASKLEICLEPSRNRARVAGFAPITGLHPFLRVDRGTLTAEAIAAIRDIHERLNWRDLRPKYLRFALAF